MFLTRRWRLILDFAATALCAWHMSGSAVWSQDGDRFTLLMPDAARAQAWAPLGSEILAVAGQHIPYEWPQDQTGYWCGAADEGPYAVSRSNWCQSQMETRLFGWPWPDRPPIWWVQDFQQDGLQPGIALVWMPGTWVRWWELEPVFRAGTAIGPGDWDLDGRRDVFDLLAYLHEWFGGDQEITDLLIFLEEWFR
jgi:hypothetical protein